MSEEKQGSVLDALIALERTELARYCEDISVDGAIAQTATLKLKKGQSLWSSKGCLLAYRGIDWTLKVPGGAGKALGRMMSGEGVTLTHIVANQDDAKVVLAANQPGRLASWDLSRGSIICTSGSFVAALGDVDISVTMARSAGAALFGGAGLFLQQLSGEGIALVHGSGDFVEQTLGAGEKILVSTGNLAVFSAEVSYGVRRTGGCLKSMFGGEGIFMTELTGPGWVMMQSLKKVTAARRQAGAQ
ncbi:MAG: AIM24 family protein [Deltaproteobacteria bacterium]|nr:AIM24 family protein [Deltaproteobacteria bacterium]